MEIIIGQRKAKQERIRTEHILEPSDERDGAAFAQQHGLVPEGLAQGAQRRLCLRPSRWHRIGLGTVPLLDLQLHCGWAEFLQLLF